jgi:multidrug efflux pump subunit AcrA (membrane-fusion protein)
MNRYVLFLILFMVSIVSCKNRSFEDTDEPLEVRTPVSVTNISNQPLTEYIELNATSAFLQKSYVKANANGYLQPVTVQLGAIVSSDQELFSLKTKEAHIVGNAINLLDTTLKFSGILTIKASDSGYLTQINHQTGDYVQDGEQLAVISNMNSFVFLLDLPYELKPYLTNKKSVDLLLPDGEKLTGEIASTMPSVDAVSQTQSLVIKVNAPHPIPENLIAKVRIVKTSETNMPSLPKSAVLADETQSEFWVMKMIDSITAVKVPITKGIETKDRIEIRTPSFSVSDRILVTGNYGLPDTAKVKIIQ